MAASPELNPGAAASPISPAGSGSLRVTRNTMSRDREVEDGKGRPATSRHFLPLAKIGPEAKSEGYCEEEQERGAGNRRTSRPIPRYPASSRDLPPLARIWPVRRTATGPRCWGILSLVLDHALLNSPTPRCAEHEKPPHPAISRDLPPLAKIWPVRRTATGPRCWGIPWFWTTLCSIPKFPGDPMTR